MKKLLITITILTGTICTTTRPNLGALLTTGIGAGTTGISYLLYQETQRNTLDQFAASLLTASGNGNAIQNLRLKFQDFLCTLLADKQKPIEIEPPVYGGTMIISAIITLYGLKNFFTK